MNTHDYVIDLLRGATTSNLIDHYDLAKSKVTRCKNTIKRLSKIKTSLIGLVNSMPLFDLLVRS